MWIWTENTTQLIDYGAASEAYLKNIKIAKASNNNRKVKFEVSIFILYPACHIY